MLIKRTERSARRGRLAAALSGQATAGVDRRAFLRRSGLAAGGLAALGALPLASVRKAEAAAAGPLTSGATIRKSICTHCSVGCTVTAEVVERRLGPPGAGCDSPINRGSHCAKGASVREHGHGEHRLKYPMKLVERQVDRASPGTRRSTRSATSCWRSARSRAPDSVFWIGSSKNTNEGVLPVPQVRRVLGHQQQRPPGAHLPLDHGRRRRQHLGLRRDDQHPTTTCTTPRRMFYHRQQRRRGASGRRMLHMLHAKESTGAR